MRNLRSRFSPAYLPLALTIGLLGAVMPCRASDPPAAAPAPAPASTTPVAPSAPLPTLVIHASPYRPAAGQAATLDFEIKPAAGDTTLPKEAMLHLFIVRDDLGDLYFDEPKRNDDGTFTEPFALPTGGEWHTFGELVPDDGPVRPTERATLAVDGARPIRASIVPQVMPMTSLSGYTLTLKQPTHVSAGEDAKLVFSLRDGHANPVTDTDLWRGAIAHLVMVDHDGKTLIHAIPDPEDPRNGRTEYLVFPVHFPKDGIWKGWVLFLRGGLPIHIPFAMRVSK